jgi:predicted DNA-binding transcriptional regulator AlpA
MSSAVRHTCSPLAGAASLNAPVAPVCATPALGRRPLGNRPIRMLRLPQVIDATGLGKTKIYELQGQGDFPMRVKITAHSVAWVEEEVQAWLASRIQANTILTAA